MTYSKYLYKIIQLLLLFFILIQNANGQIKLNKSGVTLNTSTQILKGNYFLEGSINEPQIIITGEDITIDFNNAELSGNKNINEPDKFTGIAVLVKGGKNITIINANIKGYKIALLAQNVSNLKVINCNFSYNFRPKLYSQREYEDFSDWLSYHQNDKGEWKNYGAAVYLEACNESIIKGIQVEQGFNGIMLNNCNKCQLVKNIIRFNSGVGIALYRSSENKIMNNNLSWNVRGFSNGFYSRGQDSAGILLYEQSNNNIIAFNVATHCGDGFFLWAGQTTMDSGSGGCNDNMIYGNDFSYSPTNGIELTFSRNVIYNNTISGCENGIWGGYSYNTLIFANRFRDNKKDIAIEHGQDNSIRMNIFNNSIVGIDLWQNKNKEDWAYSKSKDVSSRNYDIQRNKFNLVQTPFSVNSSKDITISYNQVVSATELLNEKFPNTNLNFSDNDIQGTNNWGTAEKWKSSNNKAITSALTALPNEYANRLQIPLPINDALVFTEEELSRYKRKDIIINEWGPYNYQYPKLYLEEKDKNGYTFQLFGPKGKWKIVNTRGIALINSDNGSSPSVINAIQKWKDNEDVELTLEWKGEAFIDQFGKLHKEEEPIQLGYSIFRPTMKWYMSFYNVPKGIDLLNYQTVEDLLQLNPVKRDTVAEIRFAWWNPPYKSLTSDRYITVSETQKNFESGLYNFYISSDDGVKVFIDDKEVFKNWSIHETVTDKINIKLEGEHKIKLIHFNGGGFANIQFRIERLK